jgi:hypothetical protein
MVKEHGQTVSFQFLQRISGNCRVGTTPSPGRSGDLQQYLPARDGVPSLVDDLVTLNVDQGLPFREALYLARAFIRQDAGPKDKEKQKHGKM